MAGLASAAILALIALYLKQPLILPRRLIGRTLVEAFTGVFAWMGSATLVLCWLPVGQSLLLLYTMPIWATLLAWPINGTRPTLRHVFSVVLGVAGVSLLIGGQDGAPSSGQILGWALSIGSAVLFALGTVLNQTQTGAPFVAKTAWLIGLGCLPLTLLGLVFERPDFAALSPSGLGIMAYMAVVAMGLCYLTWFSALRNLPASTAAAGLLAVPALGVLMAAGLLGEPLGLREVLAVILTLSGVALALRAPEHHAKP